MSDHAIQIGVGSKTDIYLRKMQMGGRETPFMRFWATINSVLKSHGLPEMLYGEARGYWQDHQGWEG